MKKLLKRTVALLLCAAMAFSLAASALAAVPVKDADLSNYVISGAEMPAYVHFFNETVNTIKTELPGATVSYTAGIPENGIVKYTTDGSEPLDLSAQNYLGAIFDGMFSKDNSAFRSLIKTVVGAESVKNDTFELHRGTKRNNSVPVYGEDYVSALEPANDYQVLTDWKKGNEYPSAVKLYFGRSIPLETAKTSSAAAIFNLPDGGVDIKLISGADKQTASFLSKVKFDDFSVNDARAVAEYAADGALTRYWTAITYQFSFSYMDAVKIMSAILGFDIYKMVIDTIDIVFDNLGRTGVDADLVLNNLRLSVTYTITVEVKDINYKPRYFGDINDNGSVDAADARAALRHAVGLDVITSSEDQLYADVDFDGAITTADARLILRMAVGQDERYTEVPEGSEIKIVVTEPEPEEPEDDPAVEKPGEEFTGLFNIDPAIMPGDIAQFVFDTIENFKNAETTSKQDIYDIVDIIKGIVNDSRRHNDKKN